MLKKTITYEDYLGNIRTEDKYFNFSRTELSNMQMSVDGGLDVQLNKMLAAKDTKEVYTTFVKIVLDSYGEVSPDGRYFLKTDENGNRLADKFRQSPAYDVLMDEICKDQTTIADFCKGIMPRDMLKNVDISAIPQDHKKPENLRAYNPDQNR